MTNQTAVTILKNLERSLDDYCELNDEGKEAFRMAITALELFGNSEQLQNCKTGKWIHKGCGCFECDQCGKTVAGNVYTSEEINRAFKYCPGCGAYCGGDE